MMPMTLPTHPKELTLKKTEKQLTSLIKQLSHQNWLFRAKAAMSLKGLGPHPETMTALIGALADDHFLVRCHAADALKQIELPEAEAALKQWEAEEAKRDEKNGDGE